MSKFYDFGYQFSQPSGMDSEMYGGVLKRLDELNDIFLASKREVNAANVSSSLTEQGKRERRHELAEQVERQLTLDNYATLDPAPVVLQLNKYLKGGVGGMCRMNSSETFRRTTTMARSCWR